jgi:hypothetical protein
MEAAMALRDVSIRWGLALLGALACSAALSQDAPPRRAIGPGPVVVRTALGGFILGYDVDQAGTLGILSEALTLPDGHADVAVETFDQTTGAIVKIVRQQSDSKNDFVTLGIFDSGVALTEFEHVHGIFVDRREYATTTPLSSGQFTGRWTPPFTQANEIISSVAPIQGGQPTVVLGFHNNATDFSSYVFGTDVAANTFGKIIRIRNDIFNWSNSPVIAADPARHRAVLGGSMGCFGCPAFVATVALGNGQFDLQPPLGVGFVNGIAVDPTTGVACTTTEDDFSVEFHDLVNGTATIVTLPGATNQLQSGGAVAVDPIHHLFLVGQEFSSTAPTGSSIHVFDEQGNYIESLNGFQLPASPAYMALHPSDRTGFVIVTPALTTLQSFSY